MKIAVCAMNSIVWAFFAALFCAASAMPSGIKPCKKSDPNFKKCLTDAADAALRFFIPGNKEISMPKVDPLFVKTIHIAGNGGKVDLDQKYNDMDIIGIGASTFESLDIDIGGGKCAIKMVCLTPVVNLVSQYIFTGKLLLFTLNGNGKSNTTLVDFRNTHEMSCEPFSKNGAEYVSFKQYSVKFEPKNVMYDFENLIQGNAQMSTEVLKVMNDNNMEIFEAIQVDYEKAVAEIFRSVINTLFEHVPHKELLVD